MINNEAERKRKRKKKKRWNGELQNNSTGLGQQKSQINTTS
jgi:hypothetical protein